MPLTITVISYRGRPPASQLAAVFTPDNGGTLGRAPDNDLVLPDPEKVISRAHAAISYKNGAFCLTDTSLAGTIIVNRGVTLNQSTVQGSARLENGDILRIGDYELSVAVSGEQGPLPPPPFADSAREPLLPGFIPISGGSSQGDLDLERLLSSGKPSESASLGQPDYLRQGPPDIAGYLHAPPQQEYFTPPEAVSARGEERLPEGFNIQDLLGSLEEEETEAHGDFPHIPPPPAAPPLVTPVRPAQPEPIMTAPVSAPLVPPATSTPPIQPTVAVPTPPQFTTTPVPRPAPVPVGPQPIPEPQIQAAPSPQPPLHADTVRQGNSNELAALFMEAAGIEGKPDLQPEEVAELMRVAGTLVREMTGGIMTMLRGRMEMKNQFRVSRTVLRTTGNNPLKFSLTAEDALKLLLVEKKPGFLPAIEAVRQGCRDVMNHELAVTAANQAALLALLKLFAPANFSQQFEEGFVLQKKSKCWDKYCQTYPELAQYAQDNFYGEDFVRAYEEQMAKLLAGGKG